MPGARAKLYQVIVLAKSLKMKHLQKWNISSKLQTEALYNRYIERVIKSKIAHAWKENGSSLAKN